MRVEDALQKFVVQLHADGRSSHTIDQYHRHVRLLASWLGKRRSRQVGGIDHEDLARFLASPEVRVLPDGSPKRAASINTLRTSLRCFFAYLHAAGVTRENPARLIRRARCGPPPPRALSEVEQRKLMAALTEGEGAEAERDRVLFGLMLRAGLRLGSALALEAEDVDLNERELRVRRAKGDRPQVVILGAEAVKLLRGHLRKHPTGPLFAGRNGGPISLRHAHRRFRLWAAKAGIGEVASSHSLRHSFATKLYGRTGDIGLVQRALGHRSIASTLVYARCDERRLRAALGR